MQGITMKVYAKWDDANLYFCYVVEGLKDFVTAKSSSGTAAEDVTAIAQIRLSAMTSAKTFFIFLPSYTK